MSGFDSIQVKFNNTTHIPSALANTRVVPFIDSYFEILKAVVNDVKTEYFWFFANFIDLAEIDLDFIPEQHERNQIHVWYTTHPMGGLNKEGNVMLIPTQKFKEQMYKIKFLRDFEDINYHPHATLFQRPMTKAVFNLKNPYTTYEQNKVFYQFLINRDIQKLDVPNFYPSFWEDEKVYSWGKTKDIMLVPYRENLKQFYDVDRSVNFEMEYDVKPMDIIFISLDEPDAEQRYNDLRAKFPRAKWCKGIIGRTLAYTQAALMSDTDYFFLVFPKLEIVDSFKFDFQPDRMKEPCHYIFHCKNPVNDLEYGHGAVLLYNKELVLNTRNPGLDFTLSSAHEVVPELSAITHFNETPWMAWRTAFREIVKLLQSKPTVETKYRLKKWCAMGKGKNAEWVFKAANDAKEYYEKYKNKPEELFKSYELIWLMDFYDKKYKDTVR